MEEVVVSCQKLFKVKLDMLREVKLPLDLILELESTFGIVGVISQSSKVSVVSECPSYLVYDLNHIFFLELITVKPSS